MSEPIEGIKLIKHNMAGVDKPDDPTHPYKMELACRVPGFMEVAASLLYGREEIIVRSMTKEALDRFIEVNGLRTHPRLQSLTITGPGMEPVETTSETRRKEIEAKLAAQEKS